ncbi:hypothetical protein APHAL10511_004274 [Amanita phalloides]|nr:hypothetical protein APHAL10511_004274 [Amanita phalloides]
MAGIGSLVFVCMTQSCSAPAMKSSIMLSVWFIALGMTLLFVDYGWSIPIAGGSLTNEQTPDTPTHSVSSSAPHFVLYSNSALPHPSSIEGFNTFNLAFLLVRGPRDNAHAWTLMNDTQRSITKSQYAAAGIYLLVSAFGSEDTPTTRGADPVDTANTMAAWVEQYQLDGIDVDYEDFAAFDKGDGSAENWLIVFTRTLRSRLPVGQYIITHAPVAPWFEPDRWYGGGYLAIDSAVGHLIDWYNIQFYNQGTSEYITCPGLLTKSSKRWPKTTVFQIAANGVPMSKIVIGEPATAADADNGYMDPSIMSSCLSQAKDQEWTGGVMTWQYPHADVITELPVWVRMRGTLRPIIDALAHMVS